MRRDRPEAFKTGDYIPVQVTDGNGSMSLRYERGGKLPRLPRNGL